MISSFSKNKTPVPDIFTDDYSQTFKDEIIPFFYNLFQRIEVEESLLTIYEASRPQHQNHIKPL